MAQTAVGDLVVNLDVNSSKFNEQITHVNRQLKKTGDAANDSALTYSAVIHAAGSRCQEKPVFLSGSTTLQCECYRHSSRILRRSWRAGRARGLSFCNRAGRLRTHLAGLFPRSVRCWGRIAFDGWCWRAVRCYRRTFLRVVSGIIHTFRFQ